MRVSGQCHCGAISFTATVDPARVIACHCDDCQVFSGGPFRAVVPAPVEAVSLSGSPAIYVKVAASGTPRAQAFCAQCGTQLYATEPDTPKVLNLRLGCIAERAQLPPQKHIWGASAMPWVGSLNAVPVMAQGPSSAALPGLPSSSASPASPAASP